MDESVLSRIKSSLEELMPKDGQAYLFGSRARGDNSPESDWDILLLLNSQEEDDATGVSYSLVYLGWQLNQDINPIMYTKEDWEKCAFTPFYHNVVNEGIKIYGA
ncbi:MAG: nucleotidyltransferase domain-containing protein [Bacteroidaceae bacterium]|nr:nucleotidyltransferase domain-containing protein [Bacteroidaceae bacterium]